jgi:DNA primase
MSLYDQLQEKLNGHLYSGYFVSLCCFHSDTHPSMFVYPDGFRCATCGKHGSLSYLNKFLGGRDMVIRKTQNVLLPQWRKWEEQYGDVDGIARHGHLSLKRYPQWQFYFKQRKIEQFIEQGYFGYISGWALFPVFDQEHKIQNIVVRSTKQNGTRYAIKPLEEKKPLLYVPNWKRVRESDAVYVVYGIIDSISLELIGLPVVTGITGKSLSAELLKPLGKRFVIVPDEYEEKEARLLANSLGWRCKVKQILYPEGTKDCDDVRRKFGNEYLLGALA